MKKLHLKCITWILLFLLPAMLLVPRSAQGEPAEGFSFYITANENTFNSYKYSPNIGRYHSYTKYKELLASENLPAHVIRYEDISFMGEFRSYLFCGGNSNLSNLFDHQAFEIKIGDDKKSVMNVFFHYNLTEDLYNERMTFHPVPVRGFGYTTRKPMPDLENFWFNDSDRDEWYSDARSQAQAIGVSAFHYKNIVYWYQRGYPTLIQWNYDEFTVDIEFPRDSENIDLYYAIPESGNEFIEKILDPEHAEEAVEMVNGAIDRSVRKNTLIRWTPVIIYVLAVLLIGGILVTLRLILRERRKKKAPPAEPEAAPDNIEKPEIKADPIPTNEESPPGLLEDILKKE